MTTRRNASRTAPVRLASSDLEFGFDKSREQLVGLRFIGLPLPPGAEVVSATVRFTVDEVGDEPVDLEVRPRC